MTDSDLPILRLGVACPVCGRNNPLFDPRVAELRCVNCGVDCATMNTAVQLIDEAGSGGAIVLRHETYGVDFGDRTLFDWMGEATFAKVMREFSKGYREMPAPSGGGGLEPLASHLTAIENDSADFLLFRNVLRTRGATDAFFDQCWRICRRGGAVFFQEPLTPPADGGPSSEIAASRSGPGTGSPGNADWPGMHFGAAIVPALRARGFLPHMGRTVLPLTSLLSLTLTAQKP